MVVSSPAYGQPTVCGYPIVISVTPPACFGEAGTVQISVPSAPDPSTHNIRWAHDNSQLKTKELLAGVWEFTYTLRSQPSCTPFTGSVTMTQPAKINANGQVKSALTCSPLNYIPGLSGPDAVLEVNPSGGVSSISGTPVLYKVDWDHNFTDNPSDNPASFISGDYEIYGKSSGTYYVAVSDVNNCVGLDTIVVNPNTANISFNTVRTNPSCSGSNGSVSIAQITPNNTYQYHLFKKSNPLDTISSNNSGSFQNLEITTYEIHAVSPQNCRGIEEFDITAPGPLQISLESKDDVKCYGEADGSVSIRVQGGAIPYKVFLNRFDHQNVGISLSNSEIHNFNYQLSAGSYYLYVQDNNGGGCISDSISVDIIESSPATSVALGISKSVTNSCFLLTQRATGEIFVTGLDGNAPYDYALFNRGNDYTSFKERWRPGSSWSWEVLPGSFNSSGEFTNLVPGSYTVAVRDNFGCERRSIVSIGNNTEIGVQITTTPVLCNGESTGSVQATATGGYIAPITYTLLTENITQTSGLFENLNARNSGSIRVTDSRGCQSNLKAFSITEPAELVISLTDLIDAKCNPGQGMLRYYLTGGVKPYALYVNDNYQYTTYNNNIDFYLDQGTYNIKVIDANGCEVEDNAARTISGPATPGAPPNSSQGLTASVSAVNHALCHGDAGSVSLTVSGGWPTTFGYTIQVFKFRPFTNAQGSSSGSWPPDPEMTILTTNSPHSISLPKGTYRFRVSDGNTCEVILYADIFEPDPIVPSFAGFTGNCGPSSSGQTSGGVTLTSITGGTPPYDYKIDGVWYNSSTTPFPNFFPNKTLSTTFIEIHDQNGCIQLYP